MLHQQINLYHAFAAPRPAINFLSWRRFSYCLSIFSALLSAIYIYDFWNIHHLNNIKQAKISQADALQKEFFALKKTLPSLFFTQDATQTIDSLQRNIDTEKKLLRSLVTPIPFSHSFIALSRDIVPDVWLTTITLAKSGHSIVLKGKSTNLAALQKFFTALMQDKLFANFSLNLDEVISPDKNNSDNTLSFQLSMTNPSS